MLELRLLNDNDLTLVEAWLNKEHVKKWYEHGHWPGNKIYRQTPIRRHISVILKISDSPLC